MKRLFVLLLVVLLPLRGWAGDAMGVNMARMQVAASLGLAAHVGGAAAELDGVSTDDAAMPPGCPMHAATHEAARPHSDQGSKPGQMNACNACDLCLPLAILGCGRVDVIAIMSDDQPLAGVADFVSAQVAQAHKPPIS